MLPATPSLSAADAAGSSLVLAINAGSSSLKTALYARGGVDALVVRATVAGLAKQPTLRIEGPGLAHSAAERLASRAISATNALEAILDRLCKDGLLEAVCAVGHRIVHGGPKLVRPVLLDTRQVRDLRRLASLAPSHQDTNLDCAEVAMTAKADVPHVGCFDTAFHHDQPRIARLYALPRRLSEDGVMSFGFHGLSFAWIAQTLETLLGDRSNGRIIVAHLGSGASLCALKNRHSIATTMGMTPLDGLPMSTRSGALDPGAVLHLIMERRMAPEAVADLLAHHSGLMGVSGLTGDMEVLLASSAPEAREAVDLFVYRVGCAIGSLAAALGGLDALVFTAGIGENSPEIRRRICGTAGWLGVRLDEARNAAGDQRIGAGNSAVDVLVLPTDEQAMIARLVGDWLDLARP